MIVESWKIASSHLVPRWWWVRVHDSKLSMQEAAHRYAPHHGRDFWTDDMLACCQPNRGYIRENDDPDNPTGPIRFPANGFAGVIRLSSEHLYPEVIGHELVHAACAVYRMNVADDIQLGTAYDEMDREEDLAYIYGQLFADMDTALRARI